MIMYSWYNGRRIKAHYTVYDNVDDKYIELIDAVSNDQTIAKSATHLVYIVKAKRKDHLESKIAYSLFKKTPKRADTYWFVHINHSDEPYEFTYETTTFVPEKIFRIDINAGFKMGLHVDKYVNLIVAELERKGLVNLQSRYPSILQAEDNRGDFQFVVVDRIFRNVKMTTVQQIMLGCYNFVKLMSTSDTQMYDIDPSLALVETVPLKEIDTTEPELRELLNRSKLNS